MKGLHAGDTRAALAPFLAHQVWVKYTTVMLPTTPDAVVITVVAAATHCKGNSASLTRGSIE